MIIDCSNKYQILNIISDSNFISFNRGSRLYGNTNENSDYDFGVIVPNETEFIDIDNFEESEKTDKRIHNTIKITIPNRNGGNADCDVQFVTVSDFKDLISEHSPFALEAIFTNNVKMQEFKDYFKLDKWKLRESFSSIVNNSWAKAHKKMTVEKDLDMYCGVKSLFHSIRLQKLACQIASGNEKIDFTECNELWNDLFSEYNEGKDWEYFKEKYKPIYNEAHSEMVKLCPKPEVKTKKRKSKKKNTINKTKINTSEDVNTNTNTEENELS